MHKSMREQSSGSYVWLMWLQIWFRSFWETLYFLIFGQLFLICWRVLRHQGWCQNIAQRSPKLLGKTSFLTLQTFFEKCPEHVQKVHLILSYHVISHDIIWYQIIRCHIISYDIIRHHITWYHIICDMIWHYMIYYLMIWYHIISQPRPQLPPRPRPCVAKERTWNVFQ